MDKTWARIESHLAAIKWMLAAAIGGLMFLLAGMAPLVMNLFS
jgi:hypothetical protein